MIDTLKPILALLILVGISGKSTLAKGKNSREPGVIYVFQDTTSQDSIIFSQKLKGINNQKLTNDTVNTALLETKPFLSLQQAVKGMVTGVLVNENTGEPGRDQQMLIRGLKQPLLYKSDLFSQQPLIIMDGVPLIADHPFVYEVKKYDNINIGPATNQFANTDMDNIKSIEVVKDPARLVYYGPLAANGVILVTTKQATVGTRQISINSFLGATAKESITPVNADYENRFRSQFYHRYADENMKLNYAGYLRDSTNTDYYGPTNWHKSYYENSLIENVNLSISGGSDRANFRFYGGVNSTPGGADKTRFKRYNGVFYINMLPFKWFTMSSMVNVARLDRDRNRNFRDRYNETGYLPDMTSPLPPGGNTYTNFLTEYDKQIDDNINNMTKGYVSLKFDVWKNLSYTSQFSFDYNQSIRDVFWPSTLMETINFVSNYFGYNQRFNLTNKINYKQEIGKDHVVDFEGGHIYWADKHKYNYGIAYDGPSDFIKVNVVQGNGGMDGYLTPTDFMAYRYTDDIQNKMSSFYGNIKYAYKNILDIALSARVDGSSSRRPDLRWYTSTGVSTGLNLLSLYDMGDRVNQFKIGASFSRIGDVFLTDQYAYGPQYRSDIGWKAEPAMISYNGFATVSRPYTMGWIGYDIKTPYADKLNVNMEASFFNNRLGVDVNLYTYTAKDQLLMTSVPKEYGYQGKVASGMIVNNKGLETQIAVVPVKNNSFNWRSSILMSYNSNKLKALPNDQQEVIIGERKLVVGESISKFWLFENKGIISAPNEIPSTTGGEPMSFNGIPLQVGDPLWKDTNGDQKITNKDRVLKGNMIAPLIGAWNNTLSYKKWNLDILSEAHIGGDILNNAAANYYDFINNEESNSLNSVKEIFYWQQNYDTKAYPFYNPWSSVVPYRKEQDLFLEDGSYFKLRAISLGYDIAGAFKRDGKNLFKRLYVYGTATNIFTLSKFSGADPSLINLTGQYDGYGMSMPKTFLLGFKIDL